MDDDAFATARVLNLLRGGTWGWEEDRNAAKAIDAAWPHARRVIGFYDRFRSAVAEDAVSRGITAVVFGAAGFPHGDDPPHAAAARAGATARFFYCDPDETVTGQRALSLKGDPRAQVFAGSFRDAAGTVAAARGMQAGDGPWQVQWGLGAGVTSPGDGRRLAASYARLLPSGSELVIAVPDGDDGRRFAALAGFRDHSVADVTAWCGKAGLAVAVTDVRAYGRERLGAALRDDGGRIMGIVARKTS